MVGNNRAVESVLSAVDYEGDKSFRLPKLGAHRIRIGEVSREHVRPMTRHSQVFQTTWKIEKEWKQEGHFQWAITCEEGGSAADDRPSSVGFDIAPHGLSITCSVNSIHEYRVFPDDPGAIRHHSSI